MRTNPFYGPERGIFSTEYLGGIDERLGRGRRGAAGICWDGGSVLDWIVWGWYKVYLRVHFGDFRLRLQSPVPGPYRARARRGWPGVVGVTLMDHDGPCATTIGHMPLTFENWKVGQITVVCGDCFACILGWSIRLVLVVMMSRAEDSSWPRTLSI